VGKAAKRRHKVSPVREWGWVLWGGGEVKKVPEEGGSSEREEGFNRTGGKLNNQKSDPEKKSSFLGLGTGENKSLMRGESHDSERLGHVAGGGGWRSITGDHC